MSANLITVTANCPSGKVAVGGGGQPGGGGFVRASFPTGSPTPTGWTIQFSNATAGNTAYVICAN